MMPCWSATATWNGAGADDKWSTNANWLSGSAPTGATDLALVFSGATQSTSNLDSTSFTANTLTFSSTSGTMALSGGSLYLYGGIKASSTVTGATATINNDIQVMAADLKYIADTVNLTLSNLYLNGNKFNAYSNNNNVLTINGIISSTGGGSVNFGGTSAATASVVKVNGANTYTGKTIIYGGKVYAGNSQAFGLATTSISMGLSTGGFTTTLLTSGSGVTLNRNFMLVSVASGNSANTYTIGVSTANVSTYSGTIYNGTASGEAQAQTVTAVTSGRVNFTGNITRNTGATGTGDNLTKTGSGIVALNGTNNNYVGTTSVSAGVLLVNGTLADVSATNSVATVTVGTGATLGGTGTINRAVVVTDGGILAAGDISAAGTNLGGTLTVSSLTLNNASVLNFDLASASSLVDDQISVSGTLTLDGILNITALSGFGPGTYKLFNFNSITDNGLTVNTAGAPSGYSYTISINTALKTVYLIVASLNQQTSIIWSGNGSDNNWSTGANWTGGIAPTATSTLTVTLSGTAQTICNVDAPTFTLSNLVFGQTTGTMTLSGGGLYIYGSISANSTTSGAIAIINNDIQVMTADKKYIANTESLVLNGNLYLNGNKFNAYSNKNNVLTINGIISSTGGGSINWGGTGAATASVVVINGANTYTGKTIIYGGKVYAGNSQAFGLATTSISMGLSTGGFTTTLLTSGSGVTLNRNFMLVSVASGNSANTYTIGGSTADVSTYSGAIYNGTASADAQELNVTAEASGRVNFTGNITRNTGATGTGDNLTKTGSGIVALSGANNNYVGTTSVSAGVLLVNGTLADVSATNSAATVTVGTGATLGGIGTINRAVVVNDGGILAAGDISAAGANLGGTLTVSSLTLNGSSILKFDLDSASSLLDDQISVSGTLTLDGILNITALSGFGPGTYKLFSFNSIADNGLTVNTMAAPLRYAYTISINSDSKEVSLIVRNSADVEGPDGLTYPDWHLAGVQGGIPTITNVVRTITSPGEDDATTIETAAAEAGAAGGGVVLIQAGNYHLNRPITITSSNVVLRGEGSANSPTTHIYFDFAAVTGAPQFYQLANGDTVDSSARVIGFAEPGYTLFTLRVDNTTLASSAPSESIVPFDVESSGRAIINAVGANSGTHVLTLAATYSGVVRTTTLSVTVGGIVSDLAYLPRYIGGINFLGASTQQSYQLAQDGVRGDRSLTLREGHTVVVGDRIIITAPPTAAWNTSVNNACTWLYRQGSYIVTAVNGNTITLNQPLRIDFPVEDGTTTNCAYVTIIRPIYSCGVENIYYEQTHNVWISGISFAYAENCWSQNVTVKKAGRMPLYFALSKFCQIQSCILDDAWQKGGLGTAYAGWDADFDCLMDSVTTYNLRHAPLFQWSSSGCVIRNSFFYGSDAQFHAGWVHECLIENCYIDASQGSNSYGYGLSSPTPDDSNHGPIGPRNVIYNNDITSPLCGIYLGGQNRDWFILDNRFSIDSGSFILAQQNSGGHIIDNNVICLGAAEAGVNSMTSDCTGITLTNNSFHAGIMDENDVEMGFSSLAVNSNNTITSSTGFVELSLPDDSFENSPSGWTINDSSFSSVSGGSAYSGNLGLHINDTSTTTGASVISSAVDAQANSAYQIRLTMRTSTGSGLILSPRFLVNSSWASAAPYAIPSHTYWSAPTFEAPALAGATQAGIWIHSYVTVGSTFDCDVDDVRIAKSPQQVYNKNFENGIRGWDSTNDHGMSAVRTEAKYAGAHGLRVTDADVTLNSSLKSTAMPVVPGLTYQLRFWARSISGTGSVAVDIVYYDSSNAQISSGTYTLSSTETTFRQRLLRAVAPVGASSAKIWIHSNGVITADFDLFDFLELQPRPNTSTPSIFEWEISN